ncbi:MAG: hypothetical protein WBG02_08875 [Candidatus Acidiferrum sp.]
MKKKHRKPKPGEMVVLTGLPTGFLSDLSRQDQLAISDMVGKEIRLNRYGEDGRAELEFKDNNGTVHFVYVNPPFVKSRKWRISFSLQFDSTFS